MIEIEYTEYTQTIVLITSGVQRFRNFTNGAQYTDFLYNVSAAPECDGRRQKHRPAGDKQRVEHKEDLK